MIDATVINKLKAYRGGSFFKRSAMNMIVKMSVNEDQFQIIAQKFKAIDKNASGTLDFEELLQYHNKCNVVVSDSELRQILSELTYPNKNDHGEINFSEFIAATIDS